MKSNMLARRVGIVPMSSGTEARSESGIPCFDARPGAFDHDRFRTASQIEDDRALDGGAGADADVLFVVGREPLKLDLERVGARRQRREAQLAFVSGQDGLPTANQRR